VFQYQHASGRSQNDLYSNTTHGKKGSTIPPRTAVTRKLPLGNRTCGTIATIHILSLLLNMRKAEKSFFFVWLLDKKTIDKWLFFLTFHKCLQKWSSNKYSFLCCIPRPPTAAQPNKEQPNKVESTCLPICLRPGGRGGPQTNWKVMTTKTDICAVWNDSVRLLSPSRSKQSSQAHGI